MNEDTKEYTLADLEDIIREYSSRLPPKEQVATEETVRLSDTKPLGATATAQADTRATKPLPDPDDDVRIYHATGKQDKTPAEPYSPAQDPEFAQGEDVPREPIVFPQNRAKTSLEQLTQSAEQQYQKQNHGELGRLRARMLLNLVLFVTATGTSLLYRRVEAQRLELMIVGHILIVLLCALVNYDLMVQGVKQMLRRRFDLSSMSVLAMPICWADALLCLKTGQLPFSAVICLQTLLLQWSEHQKLQSRISQLDTLRKASELTAVVKTENYYKRTPAYQCVPGDPASFIDRYRQVSGPERILHRYALGAAALSVAAAVAVGFLRGPAAGVRLCAAAMLAAMPASIFICIAQPMATLEKRMHKLGVVLCGWEGIRQAENQGYYPLTHRDLFPENYVKLNGVRFYGERNPNTVVSYVSALMKADGGSLAVPFEQLRASRNARICKVEELTSYPGGVGGQIDGLSVIAGTLEFMENMGVELSEVSRIPHAVYAAVNQSLCAVFAVNFSRSKSSASGLRTLCDCSHVRPILTDCDFAMTGSFLEQKLGVDTRRMLFPDCATRMHLAQKQPAEDAPVLALATRKGLAQRTFAVTGAAALRDAWRYGVAIHILGGTIGLLAVVLLALTQATHLLTTYNLLLYGFVWMIPGLLVGEWTRNL